MTIEFSDPVKVVAKLILVVLVLGILGFAFSALLKSCPDSHGIANPCPKCGGSGELSLPCPDCKGEGSTFGCLRLSCKSCNGKGVKSIQCDICEGRGTI